MFQFIFGLIRGLWPIWLFLIVFFIYKKVVKPVSIKNFDLHNWNGILKVLQKRRNKWSSRFPVEIDATITDIMQILNDFVPKINNKYSGFLVASDINKFMIQLYDLVEEFFDMSKNKQQKDISILAEGLANLSERIHKVVETYDKGEENEFIAVVKQIIGEDSLEA